MKAVGFFLTVFISMLLVFLVATGEVKRWFSREESVGSLVEIVPRVDPTAPGKNMLEFDFFDVDRATLKFTIRAELDQQELQFGAASLEEMTRLSLKNGVIVMPLSEGAALDMLKDLSAAADKETGRSAGRLSLQFESAVYDSGGGQSSPRGLLQVTLSRGSGSLDDGTRFDFDELTLMEVRGERGTYELRSTKPVKIEGPSFGVTSTTGLQGKLTEGGRQDFLLLPPVKAILRPDLSLPTAAAATPAAPEEEKSSRPGSRSQSVAVIADGPLSIQQQRGAAASGDSTIHLSFEKNVVFYPVAADVSLAALPRPKVERFECQKMDVDLQDASGKPALKHALATWEGGRVKAYLERTGDESYVLDGDSLEWVGSEPAGGDRSRPRGDAILHGNPVLRGKGVTVRAARAIFRSHENKVILETVHGRLDPTAAQAKSSKKRAASAGGMELPDPGAASGGLPGETAGVRGDRDADPARPPPSWELTADEAELVFSPGSGEGANRGPARALSSFTARSRSDALVEVRSRRHEGETPATAGEDRPFLAVGKVVTYLEAEKLVVLESVSDVKPRFAQGANWIEASRIQISQEESTVWFEGEVHGRVEDVKVLSESLAPAAQPPQDPTGDRKKSPAAAAARADETSLDVDAAFLTIRFSRKDNSLHDLAARGAPGTPVRLTTISGPRLRCLGQQLYWDHEKRVGFVAGSQGKDAAPDDALARLETQDGHLLAEQVTFDQKTWSAQLARQARILVFERDPSRLEQPALVVTTGMAEVEFYEDFASDAAQRSKPLRHLGRIKALRAQRSPESPIELGCDAFTTRADECRWSGATRELRFAGGEVQEIELHHEQFHGPVRAREIVFEEAKSLISLRGDVRGEIVQSPTALGATRAGPIPQVARAAHKEGGPGSVLPVPARDPGKPGTAMTWHFSTAALEILIGASEGKDAPPLELKTVRARDKVDLRSADGSIQLRGDDLSYDHATRNMQIFSPDGRPQTLIVDGRRRALDDGAQTSGARVNAEGGEATEKVHKLAAQVIWLLLYENPFAVGQRGEPASWLLVQLEKDVIGSFYVPVPASEKKSSGGAEDIWKMVAEKLTLYVDPAAPPGEAGAAPWKHVPWAEAEGNVIFSSGALQATAERAIYEDQHARMTLLGNPARLSRNNEALLEKREILLQRVGDSLGIRYRAGDAREIRRRPFEAPPVPRK